MSKNITECKSCEKEVSITAKTCPHCGQKNPGINTGKGCLVMVGIILIISVFISLINDSTDTKETNNTKQEISNNIKKEPKEVEKFLDTRKNIRLVIESLDQNYGVKTSYDAPLKGFQTELIGEHEKDYCLHDRFCNIYADTVQIQAIGYKVDPLSSQQVTPAYYQQVCSAVLIALSGGANKELVEQTIVQHFNHASENGSARSNVLGMDMKITPDSRGLLECSFVKKW